MIPTLKSQQNRGCYTDDLFLIHGIFRNVFSKAPALIDTLDPTDNARFRLISEKLDELVQSLMNHHMHEDVVLWETLKQREPESIPAVVRMENQHAEIHEILLDLQQKMAEWKQDPSQKSTLIQALEHLNQKLFAHLDEEEKTVRLSASRVLRQEEWDRMSEMGRAELKAGSKMYQLGYMLKCAPNAKVRDHFWKQIPLPVRWIYQLLGRKKFEQEWNTLFGP